MQIIVLFANGQCLYQDSIQPVNPENGQGIYESKNGCYLPAHGTLRILVIFAEVEYDVGTDPNPNSTEGWSVHSLPNWANDLFDPEVSSGQAQGLVTRYYKEASFEQYNVLGDYLLAPTNGGIFKILKSQINNNNGNYRTSLCAEINQIMNGNFITGHGLNNITYFDNWTKTDIGKPKITPSIDNPYKYDHVMFIWRNLEGQSGCGYTFGGGFGSTILGYDGDTYSNIITHNKIPVNVARHEYAHLLYGGNNFHCGGGGCNTYNYWIPLESGWSNLGLYNCSLLSWNAWDRQRMDWKAQGNQYNPSARNADNSAEVNGDLKAENTEDAGLYYLRDFVTTGDAIRIKLPFTDTVNEFPEFIWIENHNCVDINGSTFDQWQYQESASCIEPAVSGLFMYLQVDKEIRCSNDKNILYGGYSDYLRPITADGFYDRKFDTSTIFNECVQWGNTYAFTKLLPNPLTGGCDQERYTIDIDNNGSIDENDQRVNFVEKLNGTYYKHLYMLGNTSHIFTLNGNHKLSICTNPSSASMMNLVSLKRANDLENNLRKIYLNGVSIKILNQYTNGDILLKIRFDDVDIENDVRWCADTIILSPVQNNTGYSLNLKTGKTITLDQGLTATRMDNPISFQGKQVFASPTFFRCTSGSWFNMENNSKVIVDKGSSLKLETKSKYIIEDSAELIIQSGCSLYINNCAGLIINGNGKLKVKSGATLYISPNSILAFEKGWENMEIESGVIIANGYIDPFTIVPETTDISNNVNWINKNYIINKKITVESNSSLNIKNSTIKFYDSNSKLIVKQGGKLIVDSSILTTTSCLNYHMWRGIQVWGNSSASQWPDTSGICQQGYLELHNATIENAVCAVELWRPDHWGTQGGIIYADSSIFRNNAKSVHALHYSNYNPYFPEHEMNYRSGFNHCTFEITEDYAGDNTFYKHVDLSQVKGINFRACNFTLDKNAAGVSEWNSGIAAYNAGFSVYPVCNSNTIPCSDYDKCTFNGFYSAINAIGDINNTNTFSVSRAVFNNNIYGVKVSGIHNESILFSEFNIGYNNTGEKDVCTNASGAGIYLDNSTGFAIEENYFTKYTGAPSGNYIGIFISNTKNADEVYRNTFEGLSYANYAKGKNWKDNSIYEGLAYFCNQNTNNYADFYVAQDLNNPSGIQSNQGDDEHVTGNKFSQTDATWHFYNGGNYQIDYYYCDYCENENPDNDKIFNVTDKGKNFNNTCPSHYGGNSSVSIKELVLTPPQKQEAEQEYYNNLTDYNNVKTLYNNLVDGGNTDSELADIQTAQPDDMWALRAQLLGDSPHLSMEVLKEAADKTDVFPESVIFDIMAANPDELKKEELIKYLEDKENPLPDYMIDILKQVSTGTTYKTVLQQQMSRYNRNKTRAAYDIIRSILNDTVTDFAELRNWLDNVGGIRADEQIIASYIQQDNYTDALSLANMLPALYDMEGDEITEHNYYMDILNLHFNLQQQGRNILELDSTEVSSLVSIAENSRGTAGAQAKNILEYGYGYHYCICPNLNGTASYKNSNININTFGNAYGIKISVRPNPAREWTTFNYQLRDDISKGVIKITDVYGKLIESIDISGYQGQKMWDTRSIKSGIYFYTLNTAGISKSGKIIIFK